MSDIREIAVYMYGNGKQIRVGYHPDGHITYRDDTQRPPFDPITKTHTPHPSEESKSDVVMGYECLGLYYEYSMPHWPDSEE